LRRTLPETCGVVFENQSGIFELKRFDVEIDRREHCVVVRPVGELDLAAVHAVEEALGPLENEFSEVVIDLRAVEFLDSTGLRVILAADARSRSDGFNLRIIKGSHQVRRLLSLTGMDTHLQLIDADELGDAARS
jgi:anti-sigma B factor antagonist